MTCVLEGRAVGVRRPGREDQLNPAAAPGAQKKRPRNPELSPNQLRTPWVSTSDYRLFRFGNLSVKIRILESVKKKRPRSPQLSPISSEPLRSLPITMTNCRRDCYSQNYGFLSDGSASA